MFLGSWYNRHFLTTCVNFFINRGSRLKERTLLWKQIEFIYAFIIAMIFAAIAFNCLMNNGKMIPGTIQELLRQFKQYGLLFPVCRDINKCLTILISGITAALIIRQVSQRHFSGEIRSGSLQAAAARLNVQCNDNFQRQRMAFSVPDWINDFSVLSLRSRMTTDQRCCAGFDDLCGRFLCDNRISRAAGHRAHGNIP